MSDIPSELKYTKDHEWVQDLGNGRARIGITDYAQESLGDVTFVELPPVGEQFAAGDTFGVVESVKAASDLYMPLAGEVVAINETLESTPEAVNESPYGEAWLIEIAVSDPSEFGALLDAAAYRTLAP